MDPSLELINVAFARLRSDSTLSALGVTGYFDRVPEDQNGNLAVTSPYVTAETPNIVTDDADCIPAEEINLRFHVWSWGVGQAYSSVQCRKIAHAIKMSLHDADLELSVNALATLEHRFTQVLRDPDGITNHAVVDFLSTVELL